MSFDHVWLNAHLATMRDDALGLIEDGAIAAKDGRIAWIGPRAALPAHDAPVTDCGGAWITPGLIDCHTHLVFGGNRSAEFEMRLGGATYEEIARAGGGILSTMRATRAANEAQLLQAALPRLDALLSEGVTTVEIKSGYGLELEAELRQLRAARALGAQRNVSIVTSLLAAHAVPPEYKGRQGDYLRHVVEEILPRAASEGLADAVDAFCESIAFTPEETATLFTAAKRLGLPVKLHADQLTDGGGAALAAAHGALSADHLERSNAAGIAAMAKAGTVAVLLPGATLTLRETHFPDVAAMRAHGCRMALSTDMNPGSSPALSLLLMLNLGCTLFRMTVPEALLGVTRHAAAALGLTDRGVLAEGMRCDLALYRIQRPAELCYWLGGNPCAGRVVAGVAA
ncbi:imidazolonepropionase [Roseococcus sp. SDR]|uniref:imidazolonepropionase n=1 Tax=Roseococcus sp. SDR TaxID=2835532 RepID=UPI001BD078C5|nr:imidazolonepropionase [Roseococcus sp. SDR]MBS7789860.1 imidazolonepropionase [Roseococcus sp. SDR]MBV1845174.1 imidazolonepropionase [Roseococcus sp. SDR]